MEAHEYRTLYELETSHWWFRGLRAVLVDTCRQLGLSQCARVLDAGCGTGKNVEVIGREMGYQVYGFDTSSVAAQYWPYRQLRRMCIASVNAIPFRDETFDAALGIDVLECDGVDEGTAYRELWRVVRQGGYLIVVVPAYRWLMSPEHHQAVHASRRYTRRRLLKLLQRTPGRLIRVTHLFGSLLPPIAAYRLWRRLAVGSGGECPRSELAPLPPVVNTWLFRVVDWERRLLSSVNLPFGSSILGVVQKTAH